MTKKSIILLTLSAIAFVIGFASCSDDDDDDLGYGDFRLEMVTYTGSDHGRAIFSMPQRDDAEELTLVTADSCPLDLKHGQRLLLNYIPQGSPSAGMLTIMPRGYTQAVTDSLRYTAHANVPDIIMDSIRLKSIWRTGNYINLSSELKYTTESRQLTLVMDKDTWHRDTVHCYLAHNMMQSTAYFWRRCYCSFYIGAVWKLSTCRTVRIHLDDVIYPDRRYYDFTKK